jgi:maleamate amidohydrolase
MSTHALILVDMLNAFFDEGGSAYYPAAQEVLPNVQRLLGVARERGVFIVHAVERHHPGALDGERNRIPVHCEIGSHDAEYTPSMEPRSTPTEIEVAKIRYSSFHATELDLMLRANNVSSVVIVGVKTNVCIRATAQDAFALGYQVIVPSDATNSNRPHLAAASLEDIGRYMGSTPTTAEVLKQLAGNHL